MLQKTPGTLPAVSAPILLGPLLHHLCLAEAAPQKCPKAGSTPEPSLLFPAPLDGSSPSPEGALGTCRCAAELNTCLLGSWQPEWPASCWEGKQLCTQQKELAQAPPPPPASLTQNFTRKKAFWGPFPKSSFSPPFFSGNLS